MRSRIGPVGSRRRAIALVAVACCSRAVRAATDAGPGDAHGPPADPAVVQTATGTVRGVVAPDHRLFAGIPYAAPPVGPLRWQPPAPAPPWPGVRDATRTGPRCMQDASDLEMGTTDRRGLPDAQRVDAAAVGATSGR